MIGRPVIRPPDEQTILVTGATAGLGKAVARELADRGANVLVHGRSQQRVEGAIAEIAEATGSRRLVPFVADLASLAAVRGLAEEIAAEGRLDALVNNAGLALREREESEDGYELTFAVNYLAPFLLTRLLLDVLHRSAPARVVNVASIGQAPVNFEDVMLEDGYHMDFAYSQSKLALISFTFELADRLRAEGETGLTVTALHPATLMPTKLVFEAVGRTVDTLEQGVAATLRLVIDPALDGVSGKYFDGLEEAAADPQAYDEDARARLWELSERLCGLSSRPRSRDS
jgi:NAD(P)-dependent dehydrogenase (short-subunit alcohol dehydrogenase family)